jgi:hypothetical protein
LDTVDDIADARPPQKIDEERQADDRGDDTD